MKSLSKKIESQDKQKEAIQRMIMKKKAEMDASLLEEKEQEALGKI